MTAPPPTVREALEAIRTALELVVHHRNVGGPYTLISATIIDDARRALQSVTLLAATTPAEAFAALAAQHPPGVREALDELARITRQWWHRLPTPDERNLVEAVAERLASRAALAAQRDAGAGTQHVLACDENHAHESARGCCAPSCWCQPDAARDGERGETLCDCAARLRAGADVSAWQPTKDALRYAADLLDPGKERVSLPGVSPTPPPVEAPPSVAGGESFAADDAEIADPIRRTLLNAWHDLKWYRVNAKEHPNKATRTVEAIEAVLKADDLRTAAPRPSALASATPEGPRRE